jgi:capsular exopolysaccharide synthesis family protein
LRKPTVARTLGIDGRKGLTTLLMGRHTVHQILQNIDGLPTLSILPAGPATTRPSELLSSDAMGSLMHELGEQFSYVILDTPPVLAVTDASVLSSLVDGVLLVVAGGSTPRVAAERARRLLELVGAQIMGVVVNKVHSRDGGSYGYYGRQYAYGANSNKSRSDDAEVAV